MGAKTLIAIAVVTALVIGGVLALHGRGHELLMKWMPAIHGSR
jgi:hypothetical protein